MTGTIDIDKSNYLGSKRRLAKYIAGKLPDGGGVCFDPMCGVSAVLIEAAKRGYRVVGNDLSIVPYWYSKGIFEGVALSDDDVEALAKSPPRNGWLTDEWEGKYPRPRDIRRYLDGLAATAREWKGARGWAAKAVASTVLQTVYGESGSGYSTIRYESVSQIADTVRRAAREVNGFIAEVGGKGEITCLDARTMAMPKAAVVYFDPPYFKRDKGAVHYFQSYRITNSVLLGREWKEKNLSPDDLPAILEKLCKASRHVFVSTSSNEVTPYARELARHKRTMKRYRVTYRQAGGFGSRDEEQRQNLYVAKAEGAQSAAAIPPEDGEFRYVIHEHWRGRAMHADLRIETGGDRLAGWTINTQVAGAVEEPVTTVEAARDVDGHSKVDWQTGEITGPLSAQPKEPCDPSWLGFEGIVEPGEAGALDDAPGIVVIVDRGVCEFGAQKDGFAEYYLASDNPAGNATGRVVFSRLDGVDSVWLFSMPEDDTPNVLSPGAVRDGWVPPAGVSALPAELREEIPEERRYWTHEDERTRRETRDALVAALSDGELELSRMRKSLDAEPETTEKRKLIPFNQWGSSAKYAKRLAEKLPEHKRYVEPFCGAAAVLFAKPPAEDEILGDANPEVVFALKYVQRLTPAKFEELKALNWKASRTGFKRARAMKPSTDAERFWKLAYGRMCTWGGLPDSGGYSTIHDGQTYPLDDLWRFHERLKGVMVVRQDWKETIRKTDSADTLFFVDPPYIKEWGATGGIEPEEIAETLAKTKGKWVIAYTDSARARRALGKVGRLFTFRILEARNRGLWAKRSRLFAASFDVSKSEDLAELVGAEIAKSVSPTLPVAFECAMDVSKAYEDDGRWIVEGYAATSDFDLQEDIISEEAIRDSAKDLLENSTVLHNHNPDEAIGRVLDSRAREGGLFLKIMISKTAPEKWQQIQEGVLNKFSVRGKVLEARKEFIAELKRHARVIKRMQLVEVSLVAVPANPKAKAIRWYVEKALDEFEKAGGRLNKAEETGDEHMDGEREVEVREELIEAKGDEQDKKPDEKPEATPQPEPKPAAEEISKAADPNAAIEQLLATEKDPARRKLLEQIKLALGEPVAKGEGEGNEQADCAAGDAVPAEQAAAIRKLLLQAAELVSSGSGDNGVRKTDTAPDESAKILKALQERVDRLEKTPAPKTSLDGQEGLPGAGTRKPQGSFWNLL